MYPILGSGGHGILVQSAKLRLATGTITVGKPPLLPCWPSAPAIHCNHTSTVSTSFFLVLLPNSLSLRRRYRNEPPPSSEAGPPSVCRSHSWTYSGRHPDAYPAEDLPIPGEYTGYPARTRSQNPISSGPRQLTLSLSLILIGPENFINLLIFPNLEPTTSSISYLSLTP